MTDLRMKYIIVLLMLLLPLSAHAGGANTQIDPLNGCFENVGYSGEEIESEQIDWVTHRGKYRKIIDPDRFMSMKRCWESRAKCIKVATVCRTDGKVVYTGFDWFWRQ